MHLTDSDQRLSDFSLAWGASEQPKGEVFTKPEVVRFMLRTSGVLNDLFDTDKRILEPSCGQADFVLPIAEYICENINDSTLDRGEVIKFISNLLIAYDISESNIEISKNKVSRVFEKIFSIKESLYIVEKWFKCKDFLLDDNVGEFTNIIGNPPYLRIEDIPKKLLKEYRERYHLMVDRSDIYIAFYQKSLSLLNEDGVLSFICTDRWVKNRYGASLRSYITRCFNLDLYVDLYGEKVFEKDVLTYPSITNISKSKKNKTLFVKSDKETVLSKESNNDLHSIGLEIELSESDAPWIFSDLDESNFIRRLESCFPTLEESGCKVYIGAATGNNSVYIIDESINIEESRRLPVVRASDFKKNGDFIWSGKFLVNTYDDDGVVDLDNYPKLKSYLERNYDLLSKRHVAKNNPSKWYKTIDKVYSCRASNKKLLIPDIKSKFSVYYDSGEYHPNNSLYYICSDVWDVKVLEAILVSGIGDFFVKKFSTKISGGNYRFQAQHLRKIRVPMWSTISVDVRETIVDFLDLKKLDKVKEIVFDLYGLSEIEKEILRKYEH